MKSLTLFLKAQKVLNGTQTCFYISNNHFWQKKKLAVILEQLFARSEWSFVNGNFVPFTLFVFFISCKLNRFRYLRLLR